MESKPQSPIEGKVQPKRPLDESIDLFSDNMSQEQFDDSIQSSQTSFLSSTPQCSQASSSQETHASMLPKVKMSKVCIELHKVKKCNQKLCRSCAQLPCVEQIVENMRLAQVHIFCPKCKQGKQCLGNLLPQLCDIHKMK